MHLRVLPALVPLTHVDSVVFADRNIVTSVSSVLDGTPVGNSHSLVSEWRLAAPGLYSAVARRRLGKEESNRIELEVVSLRLHQPTLQDGQWILRADRLGGRSGTREAVEFELSGRSPRVKLGGVLGRPVHYALPAGKHLVRATSSYKGLRLSAEQSFEVPPSHPPARLELAAPQHVATNVYRFRAALASEAPELKAAKVRFDLICEVGADTQFEGVLHEWLEQAIAGRGECSVIARVDHAGAQLISERRQFLIRVVTPDPTWPKWLLLLPIAGAIAGVAYALRRRSADRELAERLERAVEPARLSCNVLLRPRPAVRVVPSPGPHLALKITQGRTSVQLRAP